MFNIRGGLFVISPWYVHLYSMVWVCVCWWVSYIDFYTAINLDSVIPLATLLLTLSLLAFMISYWLQLGQ